MQEQSLSLVRPSRRVLPSLCFVCYVKAVHSPHRDILLFLAFFIDGGLHIGEHDGQLSAPIVTTHIRH